MIKIVILIGIGLICVIAFLVFVLRSSTATTIVGTSKDILQYLSELQFAQDDDAFLVVTLRGTPDFIQFKYSNGQFEIDFPLVSERQQSFEERIKSACSDIGLKIQVSDDSQFLDIYENSTAEKIAESVIRIFQEVYGATSSDQYEFNCEGFEPRAS